MWIMLNDAFISIVHKDCGPHELLVRARRPGDIEKVFGRRTRVARATDADYLFRAVVARADVEEAMEREVGRIDYANFKDSVADPDLSTAYHQVWSAMARVQNPRPYSEPYKVAALPAKKQVKVSKAKKGAKHDK
jgi:hypothetical protein